MLRYFNQQWDTVPVCVIDTETTGVQPGRDRTVQVGIVRFEGGAAVGSFSSLINPGVPIPASATAIHGITDEMVGGAPTLAEYFAHPSTLKLLEDAQPAAFNSPFDKLFVPPFMEDWTWAWLDALSLIRVVDRYAKGAGRHKLAACCARHGIALTEAHSASADARAAGELLYKLGPGVYGKASLGEVLRQQGVAEAQERFRFLSWLSRQPPRPEAQP